MTFPSFGQINELKSYQIMTDKLVRSWSDNKNNVKTKDTLGKSSLSNIAYSG